mgnify:FL=1
MLFIVRHAECEANVNREWAGAIDSPITVDGIRQSKLLAEWFKKVDLVVTSPSQRAITVARMLKTKAMMTTSLLKEMDGGDWEGESLDKIVNTAEYKVFEQDLVNCTPPNGESFEQVLERTRKVALKLDRLYGKSLYGVDTNVIIVSHGVTIKALAMTLLGDIDAIGFLPNTGYVNINSANRTGDIKVSKTLYDHLKGNEHLLSTTKIPWTVSK